MQLITQNSFLKEIIIQNEIQKFIGCIPKKRFIFKLERNVHSFIIIMYIIVLSNKGSIACMHVFKSYKEEDTDFFSNCGRLLC